MRVPWLVAVLAVLTGLVSCQGCHGKQPSSEGDLSARLPTIRLYLLTDLAGALEPCGCTKDQLGGLDHLAAFVAEQRTAAPNSLMIGAGPMLFIDPKLGGQQATQDKWKAGTIAAALKAMGLRAWAPGYNDWAAGASELKAMAGASGADLVGTSERPHALYTVGGVKVGVIGVSDPRDPLGAMPATTEPAAVTPLPASGGVAQVKQSVAALRAAGAQILIAAVAMQRGAALRIADAVPELDLLLVGKPHASGHGNTPPPPPELIGGTLVVQTANHAQTVSVVDIYLRDGSAPARLADAGGVKRAAAIADLARRIRELETRINSWKKGGKVVLEDLKAREADLAKLRRERDALAAHTSAPPPGSFFRYAMHEVREGLGKDPIVTRQMRAFYQRVNGHNKHAFAGMTPPKPAAGEASYIGVEACTDCHPQEREVYDKTAHARAYKTLVDDFKEYNLECVGCHVTGYGKPGGSTVTHNAKLQSVQCEVCHGPGSTHAKEPKKAGLVRLKPDPKSCVERCHHPPHVEGFDPAAKMELVLGPGHGQD